MKIKDCPKCNSTASNISPVKDVYIYGCQTCGHTFDSNGKPYVDSPKKLANVFKAATEGNKTMMELFGSDKMDPSTKAAFTAKLLEYGVQMWFDGLKQGLLLTALQETYDGKTGSTEGSSLY